MTLTPKQKRENELYNMAFIHGGRAKVAAMRKSLLDTESEDVKSCFKSPMYNPPHKEDE